MRLFEKAYSSSTTNYVQQDIRTDHELLAFLFLLVAGGTDAQVDVSEFTKIKQFIDKITKSGSAAEDLVMNQYKLYNQIIIAAKGLEAYGLWSQEYTTLLSAVKNVYKQDLLQEIYDSAKEIAFADGEVDDGERAMLKTMKDVLDVSDAKGKSRVGSVDSLDQNTAQGPSQSLEGEVLLLYLN